MQKSRLGLRRPALRGSEVRRLRTSRATTRSIRSQLVPNALARPRRPDPPRCERRASRRRPKRKRSATKLPASSPRVEVRAPRGGRMPLRCPRERIRRAVLRWRSRSVLIDACLGAGRPALDPKACGGVAPAEFVSKDSQRIGGLGLPIANGAREHVCDLGSPQIAWSGLAHGVSLFALPSGVDSSRAYRSARPTPRTRCTKALCPQAERGPATTEEGIMAGEALFIGWGAVVRGREK